MLRLVAVTAFTVVTVSAASRCCDALNAVEKTLRSKVRIAGSTPAVTTFFSDFILDFAVTSTVTLFESKGHFLRFLHFLPVFNVKKNGERRYNTPQFLEEASTKSVMINKP